jgi:hypothetical protein
MHGADSRDAFQLTHGCRRALASAGSTP